MFMVNIKKEFSGNLRVIYLRFTIFLPTLYVKYVKVPQLDYFTCTNFWQYLYSGCDSIGKFPICCTFK